MDDPIVACLRTERSDDRGRMIMDIWNYSNEDLENTHDYIQWLFPLFERSAYSPNAPILTIKSAEQIIADKICKNSLNHSLFAMRSFYEENSHWVESNNHNLLRITRVLKSSALLLGKVTSIEFYNFIMLRCGNLKFKPSIATTEFWKKATAAELAQYHVENS